MKKIKRQTLTVKQGEAEANRGKTCWRGEVRCKHYAANWLDEKKLFCECKGYEPEPRRPLNTLAAITCPLTGMRI